MVTFSLSGDVLNIGCCLKLNFSFSPSSAQNHSQQNQTIVNSPTTDCYIIIVSRVCLSMLKQGELISYQTLTLANSKGHNYIFILVIALKQFQFKLNINRKYYFQFHIKTVQNGIIINFSKIHENLS